MTEFLVSLVVTSLSMWFGFIAFLGEIVENFFALYDPRVKSVLQV